MAGRQGRRPDDNTLIDLYQRYTAREIAEQRGVSISSVKLWVRQLRREGKLGDKVKSWMPDPDALREAYLTHTFAELAQMYQVSETTVNEWLRKIRKTEDLPYKGGGRKRMRPDVDTLRELYACRSASEIAAMYGVRTNTVHVWVRDLREAGEDIRVLSRKRSGPKRQQD